MTRSFTPAGRASERGAKCSARIRFQDFESIHAGQPNVEHQRSNGVRSASPAQPAIGSQPDRVFGRRYDMPGEADFIIYNQDAHLFLRNATSGIWAPSLPTRGTVNQLMYGREWPRGKSYAVLLRRQRLKSSMR